MVGRLLVSAGLASCSAAAWFPALAHHLAIRRGSSRRSGSLAEEGDVTVSRLQEIWFARLCRELFAWPSRSGLGSALADRVAWSPPDGASDDGCVFALLATPWSHFLAAWAARQPAAHVLIDGNWARRTRPAGVRSDGACLRGIARKLQNGHSVAVVADAFCPHRAFPATFLGRPVRGSLLAAQLAAVGGVPLRPVVFVWEQGRLHPHLGPPLHVARNRDAQISATALVLRFLEDEVRRTPAAWNKALKPPEQW